MGYHRCSRHVRYLSHKVTGYRAVILITVDLYIHTYMQHEARQTSLAMMGAAQAHDQPQTAPGGQWPLVVHLQTSASGQLLLDF